MRSFFLLSVISATVFITGCKEESNENDKAILIALQQLNNNLSALDKRLTALEKKAEKDAKAELALKNAAETSRFTGLGRGPNYKLLAKIKLPKNPTPKQAKEYIGKIIAVSRQQKVFSSSDPQVGMLCKLPPEFNNLLFTMANSSYHIQQTLTRVVREEDKKTVLEMLPATPSLIDCVVKMGWEKDARQIIFDRIKFNTGYLSHKWIVAAVSIAQPDDYKILEKSLQRTYQPVAVYDELLKLPGFNIKEAVRKGWDGQMYLDNRWAKTKLAELAAKYGNKKALDYLIQSYKVYKRFKNTYITSEIQSSLALLAWEDIHPAQVVDWFEKNRDKLVYDPKTQKYSIPAEE